MDSPATGLLEGMGLDGDSLAPMETDEPSTSDAKSKSKLSPAMATRIKQIKPLLSGEICFSICWNYLKFLNNANVYATFQLHLAWVELSRSYLACW